MNERGVSGRFGPKPDTCKALRRLCFSMPSGEMQEARGGITSKLLEFPTAASYNRYVGHVIRLAAYLRADGNSFLRFAS